MNEIQCSNTNPGKCEVETRPGQLSGPQMTQKGDMLQNNSTFSYYCPLCPNPVEREQLIPSRLSSLVVTVTLPRAERNLTFNPRFYSAKCPDARLVPPTSQGNNLHEPKQKYFRISIYSQSQYIVLC